MNYKYLLAASALSAATATLFPSVAQAQSSGSSQFDNAIIVTGARNTDVGGVEIPDSPKAKVAIESELIMRQTPGQTINDTLNLVPGVSFTNNDPFGSLGGSFTIRGFGSDRISQTVDGIPLNDSGNYALYTNQMLDPEIIESATVSLGSTDVDSPTASAAGGTINIRSLTPSDDMGAMLSVSYGNIIARGGPGSRPFRRVFGMIQTGEFTSMGTKAWFSASLARNDSSFSNYGGVDKQQYNGKIYQPIGDNGDFISIAGHYNQNRNNFNGSPLKNGGNFTPSSRFYTLYDGTPCTTATPVKEDVTLAQALADDYVDPDKPNSCGTPFERRYNPSNTGNIRVNSLFSLSDQITLTVDPYFQYVKANGGGTSKGYEYADPDSGLTGQIDGNYFAGIDLNGDGDLVDAVTILTPSQTVTHRIGVIANLIYELNDQNRVRLSYTFDRAKHRQTGQAGYLYSDGEPYDVFPINDPILTDAGFELNKRDRKSFATLNQISAEYRGSFIDDALILTAGARAPFFTRDLNQYCYTASLGDGYGYCVAESNGAALQAAYPDVIAPTQRNVSYNRVLPNAGMTFNFTPEASVFASYAKNLSVPGTDDLYGSLYLADSAPGATPAPETSDSFDLGLRYESGNLQAQISGWYNSYQNRLASAYNPECDCTITTNLGKVEKYGVDGSLAWYPVEDLFFYAFGSYLKSKIKNDVQTGANSFVPTAGKRERGAPIYTLGARVQGTLGPLDLGFQIKRTGKRYLNDINTIVLPAYTVADIDVRFSLEDAGLEKSYLQLNVTNLFDEVYIGSASGGLTTASTYVNIGPPRAITGSIVMAF